MAISSHCCVRAIVRGGIIRMICKPDCSSIAMTRSCRTPRVRENTRLDKDVCACNASRTLSVEGQRGSTLVIWNFQAHAGPRPLRRSGGRDVRARQKRPNQCVGISAPATHFIKVLLPTRWVRSGREIRFSATMRSAAFNAVSLPKILTSPRASRRAMAALFRWPTEIADAFTLAQHQTY